MPKAIPLTRGLETIVDDEDYERLAVWRWRAVPGRCGSFYAARSFAVIRDGKRVQTGREMQRDILDPEWLVSRAVYADHADGNTLNNRRHNLRWLTPSESNINKRLRSNNKTGFRGVYFTGRAYATSVAVEGRRVWGGHHATPEDAARAYNKLAAQLHGPLAKLNDIPEVEG